MKLMKKSLFLLIAVLLLAASACGKEDVREITINSVRYQVDTKAKTIRQGRSVWQYERTDMGTAITYPDGSWWRKQLAGGNGSARAYGYSQSEDYSPGPVSTSGERLCQVLDSVYQSGFPRQSHWGFGLLAVGMGIFSLAAPQAAWRLEFGWRYRNAEPSDAALIVERISGGLFLAAGLLLFVW